LGLSGAVAVAAACTGFLYALANAAGFIAAGTADTVLVIGADRLTSLLAPRRPLHPCGLRRRRRRDEPGALEPFVLGSGGAHHRLLQAPHGGPLCMDGPALFRHAVHRMGAAAQDAAHAAGWRVQDIDHLAPPRPTPAF
ncbi:3-oxoacyl-ACP synthase, partial [Streptomyces sp. 8P21H-1]|nr:3-oxoacyl-ACP synthase [Streptomyces sp. 8P21H-1]